MTKGLVIITTIRHSYVRRYAVCHMAKQKPVAHKLHSYLLMWVIILFRAIFDLSNKIALLILLRMFALKAKKKQKIKN